MNMKTASTKFLAITVAFIVYAMILFLIMLTLPLHAQTNAPAENGTNRPVAVTDSAQASNPIAATGTNHEKKQSPAKSPPVRFERIDLEHIVTILGIFGMQVAIVAIFLNFLHRRNKMMHETLRAMIEKGMPLTPELLAGLTVKFRPLNTPLPGLVMTGIGAALLTIDPVRYKAGWIVLFVGVALLIFWLVERRNKNDGQPPKQ